MVLKHKGSCRKQNWMWSHLYHIRSRYDRDPVTSKVKSYSAVLVISKLFSGDPNSIAVAVILVLNGRVDKL